MPFHLAAMVILKFKKTSAYLSLFVHWHIHSDQFFVGLPLRTFFAKTQGRIDGTQHVENLCIVNSPTETTKKIRFKFCSSKVGTEVI